MRALLLTLAMMMAPSAFADANFIFIHPAPAPAPAADDVQPAGLPWKVGEYANYDLNMGFFSGTMEMRVREETAQGFWIEQDMNILGQQQLAEILIDKNTGQILEMIVNGEKQDVPESTPPEIVETREDNITVPAGSFPCVYAKLRNPDDNKITEIWFNPDVIPIAGMLQQKAPSQFGTITLTLTSYQKL